MASKVLRRIARNQSSPCNKNISGKTSPSTIGSALPNSSTPSAPTSRTIPSWQDWPLIPRTGPGPAAPLSSTNSIRRLDFVAQPLLAVQPPTPTYPIRTLAHRRCSKRVSADPCKSPMIAWSTACDDYLPVADHPLTGLVRGHQGGHFPGRITTFAPSNECLVPHTVA